jgi:WD40-like Beta Propeller Repeat
MVERTICRLLLFSLLTASQSEKAAEVSASNAQPELFAPNVISTPDDEFGIALTPDGRTAFFTKRSPTTNTPPVSVICVSHLQGDRWSDPEVAGFSGTFNDFGVTVSADGEHVVFSSDRPATGTREDSHNVDLWIADKSGHGWSKPRNLGGPVNTSAVEAYPSLAADGTLYFASNRAGGPGGMDVYRARLVDGKYAEPESLVEINGPAQDSQPAVNAAQTVLVFASTGRDDALATNGAPYARPDLYVSFQSNGRWSAPIHLNTPVNSPDSEGSPFFSFDGKSFFFSSDRGFVRLPVPKRLTTSDYDRGVHGLLSGWNNIYRLPISALTPLRPKIATGDAK